MLACLALKASARPPAKLAGLLPSGVALPLLPLFKLVILTALSLGAGGGAGFFPAGRFVGGRGGFGFAFTTGRGAPLLMVWAGRGGGRTGALTCSSLR